MASVEPSPLARLKIFQAPDSHPARSFQTYDTGSHSPAKLPVRKGTDVGAYRSPTRSSLAKRNPKLLRRSPYAGRLANGNSSQDTEGRRRLNFGAGAMVGAGSGGRVGGSGRLKVSSSPPARKRSSSSSAAGDSNAGSEGGSPAKEDLSGEVGGSTKGPGRPTKQNPGGMEEGGSKLQRKGPSPKRERTWEPEEEFEEKRRSKVRRTAEAMEARIRELQAEVEDLNAGVKTQEMRIERETAELAEASESVAEALIKRLLSMNDSSHTLSKVPSPKAREIVPSARPLDATDPLPQLKVFNSLTFTSTSTTILPGTPLTYQYTATGFTCGRLLYFTISLATISAAVQSITYRTSPWSARELGPLLTAACTAGDISTLLHAISAYAILSKTRATTFSRLSSAFPALLPRLSSKQQQKRKTQNPSRRDIMPYLGESLLHFSPRTENGGVELVLEWKIKFDVTGEPESELSADVRLPSHWNEVDDLNSFSKIGGVFDSLVNERGVFEATACIVKLLFG